MNVLLYLAASFLIALTIYFIQELNLPRAWSGVMTGVIAGLIVFAFRTLIDRSKKTQKDA